MTENRSLSSAPSACLERRYPSSQKGGTIIAEEVLDLATHERCLCDPDGCRPARCLRCGAKVHVHDRRPRRLLGDPALGIDVLRFRCADRARCGAAWLILPAFLARCLWRNWSTVEAAVEAPKQSPVPGRTRRRWQARLSSTARQLVAVLTTATDEMWCTLASSIGLDARRFDLVGGYRARMEPLPGRCLAEVASLLHRLSPGVRLM